MKKLLNINRLIIYICCIIVIILTFINIEAKSNKIEIDNNYSEFEIVINKNFKVLEDNYLFLYPQNVVTNINLKKDGLLKCKNAIINNDEVIVYNTNTNNYNSIISLQYEGIKKQKEINIEIVPKNNGQGITKKCLFIGDSLTDSDVYTSRLLELFNNDVMNIELLGTLGNEQSNNEGRAGWRAYTYCNCAKGSDESTEIGFFQGENAFYNSDKKSFDFSMYMKNQNYSGVDIVFICLGTNDIVRGNHESEEEIIGYYNEIIKSIKEYNSNIIIGLWLPPARGLKNNDNMLSVSSNALKMNKYLINNFENQEKNNIYLIPTNVAVNPYSDYNTKIINITEEETIEFVSDDTHPKNSGYNKIATVFYYWIKYFAGI